MSELYDPADIVEAAGWHAEDAADAVRVAAEILAASQTHPGRLHYELIVLYKRGSRDHDTFVRKVAAGLRSLNRELEIVSERHTPELLKAHAPYQRFMYSALGALCPQNLRLFEGEVQYGWSTEDLRRQWRIGEAPLQL